MLKRERPRGEDNSEMDGLLEEAYYNIAAKNNTLEKVNARLERVEKERDDYKRRTIEVQGRLKQSELQFANLKAEIERLKKGKKEDEQEKEELQRRIKDLEEKLITCQVELQEAQITIRWLNEQIDSHKTDIVKIKERKQRYKEKCKEYEDSKMKDMENKVSQMESQIQGLVDKKDDNKCNIF